MPIDLFDAPKSPDSARGAGSTPDAGGIARALALVSELDALVAELRPEQSALYHAG